MSNINLLPWRDEYIIQRNHIFGAVCIIIAIIIVLIFILMKSINSFMIIKINQDIVYLNSQTDIYNIKTKQVELIKQHKKMLLEMLQIFNDLKSKSSLTVNSLNKIAQAVPTGVLLKGIRLQEQTLSFHGFAESNSMISLLMVNLEKSALFSKPNLKEIKSSEDKNRTFVEFQLEVTVIR